MALNIDGNTYTWQSFDELPAEDELKSLYDSGKTLIVDTGARTWEYDSDGKWVLFSDGTIGDTKFRAEIPLQNNVTIGVDNSVDVNYWFDMNTLDEISAP